MTDRNTKAISRNVEDRFLHNVLNILDAFSIFNLDNIPTNTTSSVFNVYGQSGINFLSNHFFWQ